MNYIGNVVGRLTRNLHHRARNRNISTVMTFPRGCNYSRLNSSRRGAGGVLHSVMLRPGTNTILVMKLKYRGGRPSMFHRFLNSCSRSHIGFVIARGINSRCRRNVTVLHRLCTGTSGSRHARIPLSRLHMNLGYNNSSNFSNVATGPLLNVFSSFLVTRNNADMLARIPRVFNTRAVLVGHYRGGRLFRRAIGLVGSFGRCFLSRNRPMKRGPSPKGGTKNVSALRSGTLKYARGYNGDCMRNMLPCKRHLRIGNLGLLSTPNGSLITTATLTSYNYRVILFAAKHNAPFNACMPAVGVSAGSALTGGGPN